MAAKRRRRTRTGAEFDVIARATEGDDEAIETLYREHTSLVHGYLRASGVGDPDDVASEVFVSMVRSLPSFQGDRSEFRAWLLTIAHRRLVDYFRSQARRTDIAAGDLMSSIDGPEAVATSPQPTLVDKRLITAFRCLTVEQREVLALRFVVDLSLETVAEITGRSVGAVKSMQHRALDAIRAAAPALATRAAS